MPFLTVNNYRLHYEIKGNGPAMLFVHGLGSCLLDWEHQIEEFSKTHTVVAADHRGHGDSDRPPGSYSVESLAADQVALLRALKITEVDVVGLSLGGAVAFQMAIEHPSLVRRLVIVNSFPDFVLKTWQQRFFIWQRRLILKYVSFPTLGKSVAKKMFPGPNQDRAKAVFLERYSKNDRASYLAALEALFKWSIADRLGELRCPVLVIAADQDYSPVSMKEAYVQKIADARLVVIPDSRHATPMERPAAFNRALRIWLDSVMAQRKQKAVA